MNDRINRIKQKIENRNIQKNEVISIDEIRNFEKITNIKLPQELVLFYTEICNGCKMIDNFSLFRMEDWKYNAKDLKKDFLFEKYWIWEDDYDEERINCILDGNIELIDIGDAQSWHIIVNGSERGKMWSFTDVGIQPCAPSMNFLDWFEFWLDGNDDYFYEFIY